MKELYEGFKDRINFIAISLNTNEQYFRDCLEVRNTETDTLHKRGKQNGGVLPSCSGFSLNVINKGTTTIKQEFDKCYFFNYNYFMKISTKLRYSSRLIVALAERGGVVNTTELGRDLGVSSLYLRPLALELEKGGLIKSIRGAKGGYSLALSPSEITLMDIARIHENLNLVPCVKDPSSCPFTSRCKTRKVWLKLKSCIENFLDEISIKDMIEEDL